jgi:adenylate cyclase
MPDQPTEAELIARGIYDPGTPDAHEMLAFIRDAIDRGVPIAELEEFGPSFAVVKHMLRPGERYTLAEAAQRAGVDAGLVTRIVRACGLVVPAEDVKTFTDEDVEVFVAFGLGGQIFGEDLIMQIIRVIGSATARIAEATVSQFTVSLIDQARDKPLNEFDIVRWNESTVSMLPIVVRSIDVLLRRHIEARGRTGLLMTEWQGIDTLDRAVGFCDLVGYTAFSGKITAPDLDAAVGTFGNRASDIVVDNGGSVVKLLGDEVMFVAPNPETACRIGLALAEAFAADPVLPEVRIGLAAGQVVLREGDYYGPVVNLAARVVKQSVPGLVLAPASFRELAPGFAYEDGGTHDLKGFESKIALVIVRR